MGQAEQDSDMPCSASNVLGKVQSHLSPLFNRVAGQMEVPTGPVNLRDSLPHSENSVLQHMLHPGDVNVCVLAYLEFKLPLRPTRALGDILSFGHMLIRYP